MVSGVGQHVNLKLTHYRLRGECVGSRQAGTSKDNREVLMASNAVLTKVKRVGEQVAPKTRELREAVAPKVKQVGDAIGPKARELGETLAPKVKVARRKVGFWIAGEEPKKSKKWPAVAATGAGALLAYLFDPVSGKRRRAAARDWAAARFHQLTGRAPRPATDSATIEQTAIHLDETFAPTS